jgi:hypothetical protein
VSPALPLWRGTRSTVFVSDDVYAYKMTDGPDAIWVAINRSDTAQNAENLPDEATDLLTDETFTGPTLSLPPRSALILKP